MPSKTKEARIDQKGYWEHMLKQRVDFLNEKGTASGKIARDAAVRSIRAKLRKTENRLKAIADLEKKAEEMARTKAEKASTPKKDKAKKKKVEEEAQMMSKRQQKKKKKAKEKAKGKAS